MNLEEKPKKGRKKGWSERGEKGGRPRGVNLEKRKKFVTVSISGTPEEILLLKDNAAKKNKTVSRYVLDDLQKI